MSDTSEPENTLSRRETLALGGAAALFPFAANRAVAIQAPGTEELHYKGLRDMSRLIAAHEVSALDLTHHMLDRIGKLDPILKNYATVMRDQAVADAQVASEAIRHGEYRGPLHGMPIAAAEIVQAHTKTYPSRAAEYEQATAWHDRHPGTV